MSPSTGTRPRISEVLKLLTDPQFCETVTNFHQEAAAIRSAGETKEALASEGAGVTQQAAASEGAGVTQQAAASEGAGVTQEAAASEGASALTENMQGRLIELGEGFRATWGVLPPPAVLLVDPDPRRRIVEAMGSGRWGLILMFPWTTDAEIQAQSKAIRNVARKRHHDAQEEHRAQCAAWLEACGFSRPKIAKAVWGRRHGLRRPTKSEAIQAIPEQEEQERIAQATAQGLSYNQAEQQLLRKARGSEAPASAMVRMAEARETTRVEHLNQDLATPVVAEPLSAAITALIRALEDHAPDAEVRLKACALHRALLPSAGL